MSFGREAPWFGGDHTIPEATPGRRNHMNALQCRDGSGYFVAGNSFAKLSDKAAPAATLISTGRTAPLSNRSCTRTFPLSSEADTPAARQSSAGGGAPGAWSLFSNKAIATAGASSVAMATFVADFVVRLRAIADVALRFVEVTFPAALAFAVVSAREDVFMAGILGAVSKDFGLYPLDEYP